MGNQLIFRNPSPTYTQQSFGQQLQWIEKQQNTIEQSGMCSCTGKQNLQKIPYIYLKHETSITRQSILLIYFHANSEDLGNCYKFIEKFHLGLKLDVIGVEYPGYGVYKGEPDEQSVKEDALIVYDYVLNNFQGRYKPENIFAMGRSLGTGIALYLGQTIRDIGGIILISAFKSIRQIIIEKIGEVPTKLMLTPDIFKNDLSIRNIYCPIIIFHGEKDTLISQRHAQELFELCPSQRKKLIIRENMDHNMFSFTRDIKPALDDFFERIFSKSRNFFNPQDTVSDILTDGYPNYFTPYKKCPEI